MSLVANTEGGRTHAFHRSRVGVGKEPCSDNVSDQHVVDGNGVHKHHRPFYGVYCAVINGTMRRLRVNSLKYLANVRSSSKRARLRLASRASVLKSA